jgi:hypothetical protein
MFPELAQVLVRFSAQDLREYVKDPQGRKTNEAVKQVKY